MAHIKLLDAPFEPWSLLQKAEQDFIKSGALDANAIGASSHFLGRMRDFNEAETISAMRLEHYPGMTERQLEAIADTALQAHAIDQALIIHRVGLVHPGEALVLVATWSAHRKAAFDACRDMMEALKHSAPFWKKEVTPAGERWVTQNTPA